jgi:hypothetical protein
MAELIDVANAMFTNKRNWTNITDEDKEKFFFIFNRYFSKKYPDMSQLLNLKLIDKVSALNLWYGFMLDKPFPKWFWSKSEKGEKLEVSEKDYKLILRKLKVKPSDLDYLIEKHFDFIKEELKYFKDIEKGN